MRLDVTVKVDKSFNVPARGASKTNKRDRDMVDIDIVQDDNNAENSSQRLLVQQLLPQQPAAAAARRRNRRRRV